MPSSKYIPAPSNEFQPGSRGVVLRNKLGITSLQEMHDQEILGYRDAELALTEFFTRSHKFKERDVRKIHKVAFGRIYDWAGKYRHTDLSKGGFMFARAMYIDGLMKEFSRKLLEKHTPVRVRTKDRLSMILARIHVEFLLIHPFREGNGRTGRLLISLLAQQAGYSGLDFGFIKSKGRSYTAYISAIHFGVKRDYTPMQKIVRRALERSARSAR
jgi:cell filamentation protein